MRQIIVTGAASGIGLECVKRLASDECRVAALDINIDALEQQFSSSDTVLIDGLDVASPEICSAAINRAAERLGGVDSIIHCAGIWSGTGCEVSEEDEWDRILSVNLSGSFFVARAAAHHIRNRGGGSIVLTGSDSARVGGVAGGPAYASSKGGVIALTRSLARTLGPHQIRVNAINPGVVRTPMTESWPNSILEQTIERTPLGRLADPADIADVACFLSSDAARFVSGEILEVNGGFYFD